MEPITCDILIIGAGPAGSSAAIAASGKGMDVIVVEQRAEIGVPVQCAEYTGPPGGAAQSGNRFCGPKSFQDANHSTRWINLGYGRPGIYDSPGPL